MELNLAIVGNNTYNIEVNHGLLTKCCRSETIHAHVPHSNLQWIPALFKILFNLIQSCSALSLTKKDFKKSQQNTKNLLKTHRMYIINTFISCYNRILLAIDVATSQFRCLVWDYDYLAHPLTLFFSLTPPPPVCWSFLILL